MRDEDSNGALTDRDPGERKLRADLGKRIRQLRQRQRRSQANLAQQLGVERTTVLRWEQGSLPPLGMLILLSEVLEASLDTLVAGRPAEKPEILAEDQRKAAARHLNQLAGLLKLRPRGIRA